MWAKGERISELCVDRGSPNPPSSMATTASLHLSHVPFLPPAPEAAAAVVDRYDLKGKWPPCKQSNFNVAEGTAEAAWGSLCMGMSQLWKTQTDLRKSIPDALTCQTASKTLC